MSNNRWLIVLLGLSIICNLVLVGFVAGRMSNTRLPLSVEPHLGLAPMVRALSEARREELKPLVRGHFRHIRPRLRDVHRAQLQIRKAMLAEPYVEQNLVDALARFARTLNVSQVEGHPQLVAFISALTPRERQQVVGSMPGPGRHRIGRRGPPPNHEPTPENTATDER